MTTNEIKQQIKENMKQHIDEEYNEIDFYTTINDIGYSYTHNSLEYKENYIIKELLKEYKLQNKK